MMVVYWQGDWRQTNSKAIKLVVYPFLLRIGAFHPIRLSCPLTLEAAIGMRVRDPLLLPLPPPPVESVLNRRD